METQKINESYRSILFGSMHHQIQVWPSVKITLKIKTLQTISIPLPTVVTPDTSENTHQYELC